MSVARSNFDSAKAWARRAALLGIAAAFVVGGPTACYLGYDAVSSVPSRRARHAELEAKAEDAQAKLAAAVSRLADARATRENLDARLEVEKLNANTLLGTNPALGTRRRAVEDEEAAQTAVKIADSFASLAKSDLRDHRVEPEWDYVGAMALGMALAGAAAIGAIPAAVAVWFLFLHMLGQAGAAARGEDGRNDR